MRLFRLSTRSSDRILHGIVQSAAQTVARANVDEASRPPRADEAVRSPRLRGAVLLEVVLALVLFVGAAAVISSALNASLDGVERQKLQLHAANLAVSVLAELEIGARTLEATGPAPFPPPFEHWTWQIVPAATESETGAATSLMQIEVIIRHQHSLLVHRLAQVMSLDGARTSPTAEPAATRLLGSNPPVGEIP